MFACQGRKASVAVHAALLELEEGEALCENRSMEVRGISFVGSHTKAHGEMGSFLKDVLGLSPITVDGIGAELFATGNGNIFAVAPVSEEDGDAERTIGFLVGDLDGAIAELHAAGIETDGINENARWRYTHFRAPDGKLYELVEERAR
jgi:catechol 2,3-dioxygenase-like lactoylglutathione lyase family enzyme